MSKRYNPLLEQQLRYFFHEKSAPADLQELLVAISNAYDQFEEGQASIRKTMDLNSKELIEANEKIKQEAERYKAAEAIARKNEQILRSINEHINEAIFRYTPEKGIVYINQAFVELFGYDNAEEIQNVPVLKFFDSKKTWEYLQKKLSEDGFYKNEEILFAKKDGGMFWGMMSCILSYNKAGKAFYDSAIVDIDAQKCTQNRLLAMNEELKKTNAELDRFVYSASHDLRAPLKSLLGLLQLIEYDDTGNIKGYLDRMRTSIQKLDYFIEEIIDYSMNARMEKNMEVIDFQDIIKVVLEKLQYLPGAFKIEKKITVNGSHAFYSDRGRCLILLNNLLSNAISYHNLQQTHPMILIKVDLEPATARISIQDNGKGIDEHHLKDIFKMFYRASSSSNGSGLGLYIVKEILQKLNGTIEVQSELNKGSRFILTIPNTPID